MDISMDIRIQSIDIDMDMDGEFYMKGKLGKRGNGQA